MYECRDCGKEVGEYDDECLNCGSYGSLEVVYTERKQDDDDFENED